LCAGWVGDQHCAVVWQQDDDQFILRVVHSVFLGK